MKALLVCVAALVITACGQVDDNVVKPPFILINNGNVDDTVVEQVIADTIDLANTMYGNDKGISLDGYTMYISSTLEDTEAACPTGTEGTVAFGCVDSMWTDIHVPWPRISGRISTPVLNAISAALIAHELGHLYYHENFNNGNGSGDPNHTHTEWFGDNTGSLMDTIYSDYNKIVLGNKGPDGQQLPL